MTKFTPEEKKEILSLVDSKIQRTMKEKNNDILNKINKIPDKLKNALSLKIRKVREDRAQLTQGSSGHKWTGTLIRSNNIDNVLMKLGFDNKVRDSQGNTELDKVEEWLCIHFFITR